MEEMTEVTYVEELKNPLMGFFQSGTSQMRALHN